MFDQRKWHNWIISNKNFQIDNLLRLFPAISGHFPSLSITRKELIVFLSNFICHKIWVMVDFEVYYVFVTWDWLMWSKIWNSIVTLVCITLYIICKLDTWAGLLLFTFLNVCLIYKLFHGILYEKSTKIWSLFLIFYLIDFWKQILNVQPFYKTSLFFSPNKGRA